MCEGQFFFCTYPVHNLQGPLSIEAIFKQFDLINYCQEVAAKMLLSVRGDLYEDFGRDPQTQSRDNVQELDGEDDEVQLDSGADNVEGNLKSKLEKRKRPSIVEDDDDDEVEEVGWFNARTFLRKIAEKQTEETLSGKNEDWDLKMRASGLGVHQDTTKGNSQRTNPAERASREPIKFSNKMVDGVKTVCQICGSIETFVNMRSHTKKAHNLGITDYRAKHGDLEKHMVEPVHHKCQICEKVLLLESDIINTHLKTHRGVLTMREYSAKYLVLKKAHERKRNPSVGKSDHQAKSQISKSGKYQNLSAGELLRELETLIQSV